jgi:hypothetical protein
MYTLLEKPSVTHGQNMYVMENCVIDIERSEKSVIHIDRAAESMWMTEVFRHIHVLVLPHAWFF